MAFGTAWVAALPAEATGGGYRYYRTAGATSGAAASNACAPALRARGGLSALAAARGAAARDRLIATQSHVASRYRDRGRVGSLQWRTPLVSRLPDNSILRQYKYGTKFLYATTQVAHPYKCG